MGRWRGGRVDEDKTISIPRGVNQYKQYTEFSCKKRRITHRFLFNYYYYYIIISIIIIDFHVQTNKTTNNSINRECTQAICKFKKSISTLFI